MKMAPHAPVVKFWGGPKDGHQFEAQIQSRFLVPPKQHGDYRRGETAFHSDESVCYVVYVWREVWPE